MGSSQDMLVIILACWCLFTSLSSSCFSPVAPITMNVGYDKTDKWHELATLGHWSSKAAWRVLFYLLSVFLLGLPVISLVNRISESRLE